MTTSAKLEYELIDADLQKSCVYVHLINAVLEWTDERAMTILKDKVVEV